MTTPSENRTILRDLGRDGDYSWDRPAPIPLRVNLTSYGAAKYILERGQEFRVTWGEATGFVMGKAGFDFMLSGDSSFHADQRKVMSKCLYTNHWHKQIKGFYEYITLKLLQEKSCKIAGINQVDITREYFAPFTTLLGCADSSQRW
jgi:linoleate 10R-lipoxygenase